MDFERRRRLLLIAVSRILRGSRRHWLSTVSLVILGGAAAIALTNDGAGDASQATQAAATPPAVQSGAGPSATGPVPAPTMHVPAPRPLLTLFLVESEEQRDGIAAAIQADSKAREAGPGVDEYVVYLLAGTREQEVEAIQRINFETTNSLQHRVDLRVIDLRSVRP